MTPRDREPGKGFLALVALTWAAFGLLWAQLILLHNPILPPPFVVGLFGEIPATAHPQRFVVMLAKESSLLLLTFAILGLLPSFLALRAGARGSAATAAALCAVAAAVSLVPVAQAWSTASAEGVSLSLTEYFAGFSPAADRPSETVTYARPGGRKLKLDVWRPPAGDGGVAGTREQPAVVVVHGGGWRNGRRGEFPRWNAWLADKGYVVFDIDYRLSPPPRWQDAPADVRCAVGWVKENAASFGVDPERIALMGRSAGGQLALLTTYTQGGTPGAPVLTPGCEVRGEQDTGVAAVAAFYPPTDLARLSSSGYLHGMDRFLGGTAADVPGRYRLSSPLLWAGPGDPPTFLVHGGSDRIVPSGQSELLAGRLGEAGVPCRLVELPWANHTFDFLWGGWGSQITRATLEEFLGDHLQDYP